MPESRVMVVDTPRARKDRVHTTMLIELLVLLVFLAMAFAFVTKDNSSISHLQSLVDELKGQLADLRTELRNAQQEIDSLTRANAALRISLARWIDRNTGTLTPGDQPIVIPQSQLKGLTDKLANAVAMVNERQTENAALRRRLAASQGGGSDLPNCTVTAGFLLAIDLYPDGALAAHPQWKPGSASVVQNIPNLVELASGRRLSPVEFERMASGVAKWGKSQSQPCAFRVQVTEHHSNLNLYKRQVREVEMFFYDHRN